MKTIFTQQEILIFTGTTFAQRDLCDKNETGNNKFNPIEKFEEACWNGILPDLLPEIFPEEDHNHPLFLWNISTGRSFIGLELAEAPILVYADCSVNPYLFIANRQYN